jgi:hypothetical protein
MGTLGGKWGQYIFSAEDPKVSHPPAPWQPFAFFAFFA